jgi:hypothetical protein
LKFWKNFERNVHCCTKYLCSIEIFQIPSVQCDVQICISPTSGDKLNMKKVSLVGIAYLKNIRRITPGERPSLETSKSSSYIFQVVASLDSTMAYRRGDGCETH